MARTTQIGKKYGKIGVSLKSKTTITFDGDKLFTYFFLQMMANLIGDSGSDWPNFGLNPRGGRNFKKLLAQRATGD